MSQLAESTVMQSFVDEYWDQKPGVFPQFLPEPLLAERDVLDDIRQTAALLNDGVPVPLRLFVDGRMIQGGEEVLSFVPRTQSLSEYAQDLSRQLGARTFGLVLNNYQRINTGVWNQLRGIVGEIIGRVGFPSRDVQCVLFVGNYRNTPMGIHVDRATNVLSFGVHGSKRMLAWPNEYFSGRRDARIVSRGPSSMSVLANPHDFVDDATLLNYGPLDMAYWPESYWHCIHQPTSATDEVHVSVNLTFRSNERLSDLLSGVVATKLMEDLGASNELYQHWKLDTSDVPPDIEAGLDALERAVSSGALRQRVRKAWASRSRLLQ